MCGTLCLFFLNILATAFISLNIRHKKKKKQQTNREEHIDPNVSENCNPQDAFNSPQEVPKKGQIKQTYFNNFNNNKKT